jgi:amino-acid N-acetyltransferase
MSIRAARPEDLGDVLRLLGGLDLPVEGVQAHLGRFLVLEIDGRIAGTVGLEVYGRRALLRSLGVAAEQQGRGHGLRLCREILVRARELGIEEVVLLTNTAEPFFAREGFEKIPRTEVDDAVKASEEFGSSCPQSAVCMRMRLSRLGSAGADSRVKGESP